MSQTIKPLPAAISGPRIAVVVLVLLGGLTCVHESAWAGGSTAKPKLSPQDHVNAIIKDQDAHSLWLVMARGAIAKIKLDQKWMDVDIRTARRIIEGWQASGHYEKSARQFLDHMDLPRDWNKQISKRVVEFEKKHPDAFVFETAHYHILSTSDPKTTKKLATRMDAVFKLYDRMFGFKEKIPYKSMIVFWKDRDEYHANGGPVGSAAYYQSSEKTLVGYNARAQVATQHMDPYQSMFHEGWHQYFDFYIPNAPRWFDEGFAEVFETTDVKGRRAKMRRNTYQARVANVLMQEGRLIPLRRLMRLNHEQFMEISNVAYAQSYSFITFLMHFRDGDKRLESQVRSFYKDYFWELRKGTDPVEAVDVVFGNVKLETLEELWKKSIQRER